MANQWGNPELKSFKNNYIRRVIVDTARVFVHRNITTEVEELLILASDNGAIFSKDGLPTILPAYEMDDSLEAKLGLKFQIPDFDKSIELDSLPFEQVGDVFIYTDFADDAEVKASKRDDVYVDEGNDKLAAKQLKIGSRGKDVKFLAYFLGLSEPSRRELFDTEMQDAVIYFQKRMGMPQTGAVDWYTWSAILPKATDRIAGGFAGLKVRTLQSALMANDYLVPVTSRFGTETIKTVREFQAANNLRVTGRVGFLEWNILFNLK